MTEPLPDAGQSPSAQNPNQDPDVFDLVDSDPLLEPGWYIREDHDNHKAAVEEEAAAGSTREPEPKAMDVETTTFTPPPPAPPSASAPEAAVPLDVTPVSQVPPRRPMKDVSENPSWLPEGWRMEVRFRVSGATAGIADRYFISPTGQRFRSKVEVLNFLETGSKRKKTYSDANPSESYPSVESAKKSKFSESPAMKRMKKSKSSENPEDQRKRESTSNPRDFSNLKFDFKKPPESVNWALADDRSDNWEPSSGDRAIPESTKAEWETVFSQVTQLDKSNGAS